MNITGIIQCSVLCFMSKLSISFVMKVIVYLPSIDYF